MTTHDIFTAARCGDCDEHFYGEDPNQANKNDWTPLMWKKGAFEAVKLLLDNGADPNQTAKTAEQTCLESTRQWSRSKSGKRWLDTFDVCNGQRDMRNRRNSVGIPLKRTKGKTTMTTNDLFTAVESGNVKEVDQSAEQMLIKQSKPAGRFDVGGG